MKLPLSRISEFISSIREFDTNSVAHGYSIDSRTIRPGELFFAVIGERLNGHDYVEQALAKGAIAAVVSKDEAARYSSKAPILVVADTLQALQALATAVRRLWNKRVIGITGSAGKTTTKEATAHVLSTKFHVLKSEGNFNNHFGLPLMLLKLEPQHDLAVIEMGMSHAGEIAALAGIAQPDIGVVTNVAPVHLEFFNSVAEIARAKRELIDSLPATGIAILNADDPYVSKFGSLFRGKVVTYGLDPSANVRAENTAARGAEGSDFDVVAEGQRRKIRLPLVGAHNIHNALAAISAALQCGLSLEQAANSLSTFSPQQNRGQVIQVGNITVINDCYNSNPRALAAMVDALSSMPASRRIVVAGEMLELGSSAEEMHRASGRHIAERNINVLLGVRGLSQVMVESAQKAGVRAEFVNTAEEAGEWLARETRYGDVVLMKASRGVKLERALEVWQARLAAPVV
ncbi:MAG: UDP-N-acetylmuramoyl-tripeptide--D-alanyl-D-alanine ligase [Terriglobales bacterium]